MTQPRTVTVAALQMAMSREIAPNVARVDALVRDAAARGAQIILPSELFETHYFCKTQEEEHFDLARPIDGHPTVEHFRKLAAELGVVIPISIYERSGPALYNSVVIADADGTLLGTYRKSHIPDGPGYQEKFYFAPGDTGFKVWDTRFGRIGVGICWDQWYPECARSMMLQGAELLFYPTAIGSEPHDPGLDTRDAWRMAMQAHAICNVVPVVASNRIGMEDGQRFYGCSFIAGLGGALEASFGDSEEGVLTATFDLDFFARRRSAWGFFRDRRIELYGRLLERSPKP